MSVTTPHFAVPFRVTGSSAAVVEQDSQEEIESCVEAVLRTPVGSRVEEPEFGRPDEAFKQLSPNESAEVYLSAVERWEPRARVLGDAAVLEMAKQVTITSEDSGGN